MKKNKRKTGVELSEVGKRHNIRVSTPNGYFPEDVDKIILDLEKQLNNLTIENTRMESKIAQLEEDNKRMDTEFKKIRFEMMQLNFQDTSELQDYKRLEKLANINSEVGNIPDIKPVEMLKADIPLDIVEDSPSVLENLVSPVETKTRPTILKEENKNLVNIFDKDGKLEIL